MIKTNKGYKAFRLDRNGRLRFLFHAHLGSSLVLFDTWMTTKRPWVNDGSRQKKYRSAFHFLRSQKDITKFNNLTKGKYVFLPVRVRDIQPKPRTNAGAWLAAHMYVSKATFNRVIKRKDSHG